MIRVDFYITNPNNRIDTRRMVAVPRIGEVIELRGVVRRVIDVQWIEDHGERYLCVTVD